MLRENNNSSNSSSNNSNNNNNISHSPDSSSGARDKSPHATVHSKYTITISDFDPAHATIASTRSARLPTKVTEIVYDKSRGRRRTKSNAASAASASTTATPVILEVQQEQPQHQQDKQNTSSTSSKHLAKVLEAGAKKIGLIKKKRHVPSHYLSLPVGGSTSSATSGMYMLHSEDLSVAEFAKLAGITILPEVEDDFSSCYYDNTTKTVIEASDAGGGGSIAGGEISIHGSSSDSSSRDRTTTTNATTMLGSGSAGDTLDSQRQLTEGSLVSDKSQRRSNIWDPQFWSNPNGRNNGTVPTMGLSSSAPLLSMMPVSVSAPASPSLVPVAHKYGNIPELVRHPPTPPDSGQCVAWNEGESNLSASKNTTQLVRRNSFTLGEMRPGVGTSTDTRSRGEIVQTPAGDSVPAQSSGQVPHPAKEAIDLSRSLGRRRSYSSLTAIAIELGSDQEYDSDQQQQEMQMRKTRQGKQSQATESEELSSNVQLVDRELMVPALSTTAHLDPSTDRPGSTIPMTTSVTTTTHLSSSTAPPRSHHTAPYPHSHPHRLAAHSVALLALQPSRSRSSLLPNGHVSSRSSSSPSSRARSPSPSPLSRQISMDSPQDEKEGFDFQQPLLYPQRTISVAVSAPAPGTRSLSPSSRFQVQSNSGSGTASGLLLRPVISSTAKQAFVQEGRDYTMNNSKTESRRYQQELLTPPETLSSPSTVTASSMYHHRTQSLPLLFSLEQLPRHLPECQVSRDILQLPPSMSPSVSVSVTSSPSQQLQSNPRLRPPQNSCPVARAFTPGTKVGRFTLVEER
ncbi:hypothetical protein EDD11_000911, partial [Mortierella claussenii]